MKPTEQEILREAINRFPTGELHCGKNRENFVKSVNWALSQMQPEWVSAQPIAEETAVKLGDTDSKLIICLFDNGEVRRLDEDHPFAIVTHFHFIPQPPTK